MHLFDENFVVAICFIIFVYLAYRPIRKAIVTYLEEKIADIQNKLAETQKLKEDSKLLLEEVKKQMETYEKKEESMMISAKKSTANLIEMKTKEMDLYLARKEESAIKSIENESEKASRKLQKEFTDNVLRLVKNYLTETDNNSVSEKEIIKNFITK